MHEFAMASQIVSSVIEEANRHEAKKVAEVQLIIGKMTFLGVEQIRFSYQILAKDTILDNSKLLIEEQDGIIRCDNCRFKGMVQIQDDPIYHVPIPTLKCPKCEHSAKIIQGNECTIKSIRLLKDQDNKK
jgi:hydrogenase nickel incorporation protein HypA/HybF